MNGSRCKNPIIYYVFEKSLCENPIIYYVLETSQVLIFRAMYENLSFYYVLKGPNWSQWLKPPSIHGPPSP